MVTQARLEQEIESSSRNVIANEISELTNNWPNGKWLKNHNRYTRRCSTKLHEESAAGATRRPRHKDLRQIIASSTIGHCFDAWAYFSRALESFSNGDTPSAIHLAYYAELRATMSLLASEGIGVFDKTHVVVQGDGRASLFRDSGTHAFAWDALNTWSNLSRSSEVVLSSFRPMGVSLKDCVDQFSAGTTFLASSWLNDWGLDVRRLKDDRAARNEMSYTPHQLINKPSMSANETFSFLIRIWACFEPDATTPFYKLDEGLLTKTIGSLFFHDQKLTSNQATKRFEGRVSAMLDALPFSPTQRSLALSRLTESTDQDVSQILQFAESASLPNSSDFLKEVFSRTILLLRLCSGSLSQHFDEADIDFYNDLSFWWSSEEKSGKIWRPGEKPDSFQDLWLDISDAITEIEEFLQGPSVYRKDILFRASHPAQILSTAERAFFWSMAT